MVSGTVSLRKENKMVVWTICLRTVCQHNTYCVDSKDKIEPYINKCMEKVKKYNKYTNTCYVLKWLMSDYGVIYKADEKGEKLFDGHHFSEFGKVEKHSVH